MKITYEWSTLEQILTAHHFCPISYVHLDEEEFAEVLGEAITRDLLETREPEVFYIKDCNIAFYKGDEK